MLQFSHFSWSNYDNYQTNFFKKFTKNSILLMYKIQDRNDSREFTDIGLLKTCWECGRGDDERGGRLCEGSGWVVSA